MYVFIFICLWARERTESKHIQIDFLSILTDSLMKRTFSVCVSVYHCVCMEGENPSEAALNFFGYGLLLI